MSAQKRFARCWLESGVGRERANATAVAPGIAYHGRYVDSRPLGGVVSVDARATENSLEPCPLGRLESD